MFLSFLISGLASSLGWLGDLPGDVGPGLLAGGHGQLGLAGEPRDVV